MKPIIYVLLLFLTSLNLNAQSVIVRQSQGQSFYYTLTGVTYTDGDLQPILNQSQDGDTIYLPAAECDLVNDLRISKRLVIVGAGSDADSAFGGISNFTTNYTYKVFFAPGSSNAEVHGIDFGATPVNISQNSGDVISGIKIYRCKLTTLKGSQNTTSNHISNLSLKGCIIYEADINGVNGVTIDGCYIQILKGCVSGTTVSNCNIALTVTLDATSTNQNVTYKNNIFIYNTNSVFTVNEHSTFLNNAWVFNNGASLAFGTNVVNQQNNLAWTSLADVFVSAGYFGFGFNESYHVVNATVDTMGIGHSQVGFYGAQYQWKDGAVPFNPQWKALQIDAGTAYAFLGITVQATAQDPSTSKIKSMRYWTDQHSLYPSDLRTINFNPSQRNLNYQSYIDLCSTSYGGPTQFFFQLQDDKGSWSNVQTASSYIITGAPGNVTIQQLGSQLASTSVYGNQWYVDGVLIPGATNQYCTPPQTGTYTDVVTNMCGSATSNQFFAVYNGIENIALENEIKIYPNPATDNLQIKTTLQNYDLEICDMTGRTIPAKRNESMIDISALASGVYQLKFQTNVGTAVKMFVKQ